MARHRHRLTSDLSVLAALLLLVLIPADSCALREPDPACEVAERCFEEALARPAPGLSAEARDEARLARLAVVQQRHPGSIWAKRAGLLRGLLLMERDPGEAIRHFKAAEHDFPILEEYIRLWTAEARRRAGDAAEAARMFEALYESVGAPVRTRAALWGGEAWFQAGACDAALALWTKAVGLAPLDPGVPGMLLKQAECQLRQGQTVERQSTLRQLWTRYPQSPEAQQAQALLAAATEGWAPAPEDLLARAQAFYQLALHAEAVKEWQTFLSAAPLHPRREDAKAKLGLALVRLKRYDQARQVFADLAGGSGPQAGEAAVWLARIYLRLDNGERLLGLRGTLGKTALTPEQGAAILLMEGTWLEDRGRWDEALARYQQAVQLAKDHAQRLEPLWRSGWIQYRIGRYKEAAQNFQAMLAGPEDAQYSPQALYWLARSEEQDRQGTAAERYQRLCRRHSFSYYCQLARLRGGDADMDLLPGPSLALATADAAPLPADRTASLNGDVVRDPRYLRARELKVLGRDQEASAEVALLIQQYGRNRSALLELSALLGEAGAHHQALRLARLHFRDVLERGGDAPPVLWEVAYPTVYLPLIKSYAGVLDPFLAAAIIREESQYDQRAVSRVGAIGLMQLMPATARTLARGLGLNDVMRDELFDHELNIRFGVLYLEQLLEQFRGNIIYTIAAYNAGPQAVSQWIAREGGRPPDEFVELIPYHETRQYVKRVLRSYGEYRRLGGLGCAAAFLDKTC